MERDNGAFVLFLCTGNYYRSRTAEALFDHYASETGLSLFARSRGLRLNAGNKGPISRHAVAWLTDRQVPFERRDPMDVSEQMLASAEHVVAVDESEHRSMMQERFAEWADQIEYWVVHDIDLTAPREALDALNVKVRAMVERLRSEDQGAEGAG